MKNTLAALLLFAAAPVAFAADQGVVVTPEYLAELSEEMRTNHPALRAAASRTSASAESMDAVRTWEDPMAHVGGMAAERMMRADDGDVIYGVEQKLPLFGKPGLARRIARAELAVNEADAEYQFQLLRVDLARAAFRAALASELIEIGAQDVEWLDVMIRTMDGRYRAGQGTLVELVLLENERSRRATRLETDRRQLDQEHVTLNRLLNRDLKAPWPRLQLPPIAGPVHFNQRLIDLATRFEPKIQVLEKRFEQAAAELALTRRQRLPDVSVGLEGRNYSDDASFRQGMFTLSMNLPWVNAKRYRGEIRRDEARVKAAELDVEDYRAGLREEVHQLTVRIDAARREALLYKDEILPRSETALESARAGWEANQASLRDVLDARRMLLEARLMQARAIAEQYEMLSDLVLCCGLGDLGALQMIGAEPDLGEGASNK